MKEKLYEELKDCKLRALSFISTDTFLLAIDELIQAYTLQETLHILGEQEGR